MLDSDINSSLIGWVRLALRETLKIFQIEKRSRKVTYPIHPHAMIGATLALLMPNTLIKYNNPISHMTWRSFIGQERDCIPCM